MKKQQALASAGFILAPDSLLGSTELTFIFLWYTKYFA